MAPLQARPALREERGESVAVKAARKKAVGEPVARLTWANVLAWRLRRQHLHERRPAEAMLAVVADICGLQAQVMSSAE